MGHWVTISGRHVYITGAGQQATPPGGAGSGPEHPANVAYQKVAASADQLEAHIASGSVVGLADKINAHLAAGGGVQVTTYMKSTIYQQKHAGWFLEKGGALHVKRARTTDTLSIGGKLSVGLKVGRLKETA